MFPHVTRLVLFAAVSLGWSLPSGSAPIPPDLMIESHEISNSTNSSTGQRELRFSAWTINRGTGPLELRGGATSGGTQEVYQRLFNSDGTYSETLVGTFAVVNGRLRFTDSADYFLKEVMADDGVGGTVGSNEKVAYCLVDSFKLPSPPPNTPNSAQYGGVYPACGQVMGISVGWVDYYGPTLTGQAIVTNGVTSGTYWLETVADPLNRLSESDETNNTSRVKAAVVTTFTPEINIVGNSLSIASNSTTPSLSNHTDFGYVDVANGTVTRTFTIQNTGTGTLSLTGVPKVQVSGSSDFTVSAQPASPVTSNGTTTVGITFDPSSTGTKTATVSIVNNDANESPYQFAISGNTDADNDGLPDGWETLYNVTDPNADNDGDGMSNRDEFIAGTLPRDGTSVFRIKSIVSDANGCEVSFDSLTGRVYRVESRDNFTDTWTLVEQKTGNGSQLTVNDPSAGGVIGRYYRLTVSF